MNSIIIVLIIGWSLVVYLTLRTMALNNIIRSLEESLDGEFSTDPKKIGGSDE